MQVQVKLDVFEGPLDLLLHLVEANEVDILQLPLARIAEQYLEIVLNQPPEDLARAGDYLLMAATLVRMKVRGLLPPEPREDADGEEEGLDPGEELARRLLEYRIFREAAVELERLRSERGSCFARGELNLAREETAAAAEEDQSTWLGGVTPAQLARAFRLLLRRSPPSPVEVKAVPQKAVTVVSGIRRLLRRLKAQGGRIPFEACFDATDGRPMWIVVFLGLLELARRGRLNVYQEQPFERIWVQLR